ncbi:uncharacterized protein C8R40DRAFT_1074778 [Lentinula edodes]|uniref:uncharacterized protein n=1 Tax=Lentinula edodes TaxID=5353 RepID=UPI001E8EC198|nr:uncharacterized protein C8R40DRAFT_1074778 [Lentinula edodes]KAH7868493.1 hypothetical protein C8R40DRAFT_1074778 [Lentinula edodes]
MYPHYDYSNGPPPPNMTQYLLGVGPLPPPPAPQQQAVAQINQVLDRGAFNGTQLIISVGNIPGSMIKVDIPQKQLAGSSRSGQKSKHVYVTSMMELESGEDIELGWQSSRCATPFSMVIKNTTPNIEKEVSKKPLQTTDTSYGNKLTKLKERLHCMQHSGHNSWRCDEYYAGQHVNLGIEEITLWARKWHDGESDGPLHPPSVLNLDDLVEKQATQQACSIKHNQEPSGQLIHIHLDSSLQDTAKSSSNTPTKLKLLFLKVQDIQQMIYSNGPIAMLEVFFLTIV